MRCGINADAIFTTVDAKSTHDCLRAAQASRFRVAMGQMMMDVDSYAPKPHKNLTQSVLNESAKLCEQWHRTSSGRLTYAFSPRFALTCSATLLRECAKLAKEAGALFQIHPMQNNAGVVCR